MTHRRNGRKRRAGLSAALWALTVAGGSLTASAEAPVGRVSVVSPLRAIGGDEQAPVTSLVLDGSAYDIVKSTPAIRLTDFALSAERRVELDLEQVEIFAPNARIVRATPQGEVALPAPDIVLLSGRVVGEPRSEVFLGLSPHGSHGIIRLPDETFVVSSGPHGDNTGPVVYDLKGLPPGAITWREFECGTEDPPPLAGVGRNDPAGIPSNTPRSEPPARRALIAIETDYHFVSVLFSGDYAAAEAYVAILIGAVSEIYERDFNVELRLNYLRLWPDINDPWDQPDTGGQLYQFRSYWNANMDDVQRDLAHFVSGRMLGGGMAFRPGICNSGWEYGVSAVNGHFPYPLQNNHSQNWDPFVIAHEMGHNFGAPHTHSMVPPIDGCGLDPQDCSITPDGTIMSYCHGCPGGMTNIRLEFHEREINEKVLPYLDGASSYCNLTPRPLPPLSAPYPHDRQRNRYLSFDPNHSEFFDDALAFKVTLKGLTLRSCDVGGNPDVAGWPCTTDDDCRACSGGAPGEVTECWTESLHCPPGETCDLTGAQCVNDQAGSVDQSWWVGPEHPTLGNDVHLLVSEPYRKVSGAWPDVVHLADCEVVPVATYGVRAVNVDTAAESDELVVRTTAKPDNWWADCVGTLGEYCTGNWASCTGNGDCPAGEACLEQWSPPDGFINFQDVNAAVVTFSQQPGLTVTDLRNLDLHGSDAGNANLDPPNYVLNFVDIANMISAFQGRPYPYNDPADCPTDVGAWP